MFNAIAEPQRRRILALLLTGERAATEIADTLALAASPTSKHLRVLREVGLVRVREQGRQRYYALDAHGLREVHEWTGGFARFWSESFDRLEEYVRELQQTKGGDADG
ncbi:DNA-binding transcriptional ArsR family regulator [Longimicrobium terrae]|uniref:DNA-binding transcriptional ArsR family regulator n=1 Tax=Longimicrobium terrae TaxID=1639882 RepID=A0A841GV13_9BACT|nr:DNA-binding transcriptional ArsR family regulator [Longimicrobium terrae]